MANTKDYAMREMILDRCFSTGKEYTREQLMDIINKELVNRGMLPIRSRNTFSLDINEMNSKFLNLYGMEGIVFEDCYTSFQAPCVIDGVGAIRDF